MTRMRIAIAAVLSLAASTVQAQSTHFTVSAASASVYKAPTNVSPVIGEAKQGATLEVTRDVGSWVKVAWSKAPDGVGYVRKTAGTLGTLGAAVAATTTPPAAKQGSASQAAAPQTAPPASASVGAPAAAAPRSASAQTGPVSRPRPSATVPTNYVAPSHRLGLGGQVGGSAVGAGFSVRGWTKAQKIGVQFDVTHSSMTNDVFFTRMSSTQAGPRVLYAFSDHVSDSTWVRPYLGAGAHMLRASVSDAATGLSTSSTKMAAQLFGGAEVTLAAVPRLGLSADVGYQWYQSPFVGYTLDGMMMSVSAHWYLK